MPGEIRQTISFRNMQYGILAQKRKELIAAGRVMARNVWITKTELPKSILTNK